VTVSARSLKQGGVEVKRRSEAERRIVLLDDFMDFVFENIWG
jgi:hypothetical protein